jgi:hypothetical protein
MVTVTIENRSGFGANVTVGNQGPILMPTGHGMTFNVEGQVIFQATSLGPPPANPTASVPWPYNPPRNMAIGLLVDNNTGQFFFNPSGSIQ